MKRIARSLLCIAALSPAPGCSSDGGDGDGTGGTEPGDGDGPTKHCENAISTEKLYCDGRATQGSWPLSEPLVAGDTYSVTFTPVSLPFTILVKGEPAECCDTSEFVQQAREYITEEGIQCIEFVAEGNYPGVAYDYFISGWLPSDNVLCKGGCAR